MRNVLTILTAAAMLTLGLAVGLPAAAEYPNKPVTVIEPSSAGGSSDVIGRAFATVAERYLGQPLVVVNRPAAAGKMGTLEGAKAAPDGYTLTFISTARTSNIEGEIAEGRKPPFTRKDFIPIGSFTLSPTAVVVPYNSPWKSLADLIKDCKAKPNHYAFGSGGLYVSSHLAGEILMRATGIKARHVPYKGGGECVPAVVGGHVDFATQYPSTTVSLAAGNKLRFLAVQSDKRLNIIPQVPTCKEMGIDAEFYQFIGLFAPQKTPSSIVERLRETTKKVVEDKSFITMIENMGDEVRPMIGDELARYWEKESQQFARILKQLLEEKK